MSGLEFAVISLGTAVAKSACEVWLGDHKIVAVGAGNVIDVLAAKLSSLRERRQFHRMWEQTAELIAERLEPLIRQEFRGVPDNEILASVDAVTMTFETAALTDSDLFAVDLDAGYLDRHLREEDRDRAVKAGLSAAATAHYDLLLRECCAYLIEIARTLPVATAGVAELLRRERQILDQLREMLERLPARRGVSDFERDYRQLVVNRLDRVEFFGATMSEASRRYPLSVAYLCLTVSGDFRPRRTDTTHMLTNRQSETSGPTTARVDGVLAGTRRLLVRGQAGLGKTTLLQWIAAQSARGSFGPLLAEWNETVPFFIPLRRHSQGELPSPEAFLSEIGRHIADEMPPGWVHEQLRSGRGVVLVDGVDELTEERREDARQWLRDLVTTFPHARFVVTSRPAAIPAEWLGGEDFDVAELEPMSRGDLQVFVGRWHEAMREQVTTQAERDELTEFEEGLRRSLAGQRHLRQLASFPLMCALLCALHRDRRAQLPGSRMELYEVALHMLLERRDAERRIAGSQELSRTDKTLLLRDIAYWLIRNGWSSAPAGRALDRLAAKLGAMGHITMSAGEVYRLLLERSGLLREPIEGETDFVHRTFQEYLAAAEAVETDDVGALIAHADQDLWSDVVVLAAGHATARRREELINGLLADRGDMSRLIAVACLETSPELAPHLRLSVLNAADELLPPRNLTAAKTISRAGTFALDLLAKSQPHTLDETAATIRAAVEIGDPAALPILARFGRDPRVKVQRELLRGWRKFDPVEYAQVVLADLPLRNGHLEVDEPALTAALSYLNHLTGLRCTYVDDDGTGLEFLRRLSRLTWLEVSHDVADLGPLAGSLVSSFYFYGGNNGRPHDLAPLADATELINLWIWSGPITNVGALARCRNLRELSLSGLGNVATLAELSPLRDLTFLSIDGVADLTDPSVLGFLRAPTHLSFEDCPFGGNLGYFRRWADSLSFLYLWGMGDIDLAQLAGQTELISLDLRNTRGHNVAALASLPELTALSLSADSLDLRELRSLPSLRHVNFSGVPGGVIDLTPLAGMTTLTVSLPRGTHPIMPTSYSPRVERW